MSYKPGDQSILTEFTDDVLRATDVLTQKGPVKQVRGDGDLVRWVRSQAYRDLIGYINNTSLTLRGHRLNGNYPVSEQMRRLCEMFDTLERLVTENAPKPVDPLDAPTHEKRVKTSAYRTWLRQMFQIVLGQLAGAISADKCKHIHELGEYLRRSFGNATTLDFGPGNEMMFLFFLCGLFRSGILLATDTVAAALMLFHRYIRLVRRLASTYDLPMAAQPRCCLEDYFVVPYMWGAAQLCLYEPFPPPMADDPKVMMAFRQDFMLLDLIDNLPVKGGQLSQKAFQLWCILSAPTWPDVYRGIERSYINHILASFHTVENAIFWELMSFDAASSMATLERPSMGQRYQMTQDTKFEEQGSGHDLKPRGVSFAPVRTYVSLELVTDFLAKNQSEEESSVDEGDDRLAMPHPSNEPGSAAGSDMGRGKVQMSDSSSNLSTETRFFIGKHK